MNKLFIVLLAVCLVNVHAFVKREAETAPSNNENKVQEILNNAQDQLKNLLNPDNIKKSFNEMVDNVNKFVKDIQHKEEGAKQ